jgi:hypothetical protein
MKDPLALDREPTPQPVRAQQIAPPAHIVNLHNRILGNGHADSAEVKLALLAHLIFSTYSDIKANLVDE